MSARTAIDIDGRTLSLSNLDKVLYPSGFTKGELIDYFVRVAAVATEHLRGGASRSVASPDGTGADGFFEKRCNRYRPDWVPVAVGPGDRNGTIEYCRIEDAATMAWAANLAAIELHAPMALAADLDTPRALVFDFDPGPGTSIVECCQVALASARHPRRRRTGRLVQDLGLEGHADVRPVEHPGGHAPRRGGLRPRRRPGVGASTGRKGHHRHGQGGTTGQGVRRLEPDAHHKTTIAPYSTRARERPTVSTPVTWAEVSDCADGRDWLEFDTVAVLARVDEFGDLFAPVLTVQHELPTPRSGTGAATRA